MSRKRWAVIGLGILVLPGCLLVPCLQKVRDGEGWVRSANSLKQIGLALQMYHDARGRLPPAVVRDGEGRPLYSWRVLLLPYLDQGFLYNQFKLDEPWDSPHNVALARETPRCYHPALVSDDDPGLTRYQVFVGPGTAFERPGRFWTDFPDGVENTLLVVEAGEPVPWSKPADLVYAPDRPLPPLGAGFTKPVHFACYEVGRRNGFVACFADGSVRFIPDSVGEATVRGLITRNGGEAVTAPPPD